MTRLADVDREIDDAAIERLAFLSGHTPQQLLRGTLRADVEPDIFDIRDQGQRLLLRHGDLVLNQRRGGRAKPVIQYCPVCLGADCHAAFKGEIRPFVETGICVTSLISRLPLI